MNEPLPQKISRRELLRGALLGGAGLFGASLLACGDSGDTGSASPTANAAATPGGHATLSAPNMTWQKLTPSGAAPPARYDHSLVTDGTTLYLFGGRAPDAMGDLWTYDIAANEWSRAQPQQPFDPPVARFGHNAIWDPQRSVMVVFGGQDGTNFYNDLWEYNPATNGWNVPGALFNPAALPAPRYGAAACYDNEGHFLVSHGMSNTAEYDDTWQFDLALGQWTDLSPAPGEKRPAKRALLHGAWDIVKRRLLVFDGQSADTPLLDDLWGWSPEFGWQRIARDPHPSPRNLYSLVYDAKGARVLVFGGKTQTGPVNDLWIFYADGENWAQGAPQGQAPAARYGHDMAMAPNITPYVFGGTNGNTPFDDLWHLDILPAT